MDTPHNPTRQHEYSRISMATNNNKKSGDGLFSSGVMKTLDEALGKAGFRTDIKRACAMGRRGVCHNCQEHRRQEQEKLLKCGACKKVFYCSKECQKTHWKQGGHREECSKLKGDRKEEQQKRKAIIKEEPAPTADQFLDANLDANGLWREGVQLLDERCYSEVCTQIDRPFSLW
jgi:hypothetical protein